MAFVEYPAKDWNKVLPDASADAIRLVQKLIVYQSGDRMKADQVSLSIYDLQSSTNLWQWRTQSFFNEGFS